MKKSIAAGLILTLLLTGCAPQFDKEQEVVQDKDETEKAIIPKYQISDDYYKMLLPFEPSKARGMVVSNLNTRYDIEEFETGLMRIAQNDFDTDKYVFKEGQVLDKDTISSWLERKYTKEQLKEKKMSPEENVGLNPLDSGAGDIETRSKEKPIYLAHILEHDYLQKSKDNKEVSMGGAVIGLALNSIYYYQKEAYGATYDVELSEKKIREEGEKIAAEVLKRLRKMDEFKNVPITIALFEQVENSSVVPGNFIQYTHSDSGSKIGKWQKVNEKYFVFPSTDAEKEYRDDVSQFKKFKQDVEEFFPNFNGVIGKAFYADDQIQELNIEIPIQFYGNSEAIGFTQYLTGLVMEHFPEYISVQVSITSVNGPEALIVRKSGDDEPYVHIYK